VEPVPFDNTKLDKPLKFRRTTKINLEIQAAVKKVVSGVVTIRSVETFKSWIEQAHPDLEHALDVGFGELFWQEASVAVRPKNNLSVRHICSFPGKFLVPLPIFKFLNIQIFTFQCF
jgi:hypothetical protein